MTGTAIQRAPEKTRAVTVSTGEELRSYLTERQGEFAMLAKAARVEPEELIAELVVAAKRNPDILSCSPESIVAFMYDAASTGLIVGKGCFAVPIRDKGTLKLECWVGAHGMRQLATIAGGVRDVFAQIVYEGDEFEEILGLYPDVKHKKGPNYGNMKKAIGVYGVLAISQSIRRHVYLTRERVEALRKMNRADTTSPRSPWVSHEQAMWEAKAVLAVCKTAPRNARFAHALALTERNENLRLTADGLEPLGPDKEVAPPSAPAPVEAVPVKAAAPAFEEEPAQAPEITLPNWRAHPLAGKKLSEVSTDDLGALYSQLREALDRGDSRYAELVGHLAHELDSRRDTA